MSWHLMPFVPIETLDDVAASVAALAKRDRRLKAVIEIAGALPLRRRAAGFAGLARVIVGQQLSVASASAIWARLEAAFPDFTPQAIAKARTPKLKKAGLSAAKIKTLKAIAAACAAGLDLDNLGSLEPDEARRRLQEIKGVGPWTADIYLLFCLGHPDVFPHGDLALRNAVAEAFGTAAPMDPAELAAMAEHWAPHRSVAAYLFWAFYGAKRAKKVVPA
jgi:DNA-3-methyladenine glycosylase II